MVEDCRLVARRGRTYAVAHLTEEGKTGGKRRRTGFVKDRILIRVSYWVAAIVDFAIAIAVLIPERMGVEEFVYPMGLMSAVAFSWAVLLIVADRKPVERRWVLLPTMLVAFLLGVAGVYAASVGVIPVQRTMASSAVVVGVLLLLAYTCYRTRNLERAAPPGVSE